MLRIDFGQSFLDHRSILVLVKKLGSIKEDEFSELFDDISQLRTVELPNSRTVHLRYTRHISHQFVDWGSFHTHKKLLGILSIARYSPDKDLESIKVAHESLKTWYSNTSLDSRCFLLGYEKPQDDEKKKHSEFVFLNQHNLMEELESHVADYALSLFLVLESKRMDKSLEKPEKVTLLRSPLDGEMPVDIESRNRKQCIGRMKKYMGDLCLVAGLPQEAVFHYSVAIDLLRSVGDALWFCGSMEGMCAASLLCRTESKSASFERPSLQLNINQLSTAGPVNGGGADNEDLRLGSAIPLTDEEIIEKSDDIFQVYERHKESKVLGVEARFKYARFFISKKRYKEASTALQDVLSAEFSLSDAEKIQQYSAMSIMYEDIGFMRKAAFFTRKAALHCTSQHLPIQGWTASYNLLRNALEGYKINFDNIVEEEATQGWPELQIQLMQELIKMSEELQTPNIPIRHLSYLVHEMHKHMEESNLLDLITLLEHLAAGEKHCSLVDNFVLSNGDKLPPVSLTSLPVVRGMKVNVLASHLRPFVSPASPAKTPFIFSTLNKKPGRHKKGNPVVRWVEGDVGEVAMQVFNPMPFDVKVSKMALLTEGVPFETFPSCLALSNDGMSHPFMLLGTPKGPGELRITGYSVEVFGIQSNCAITETILDNPLDLPLVVNVTPRLPLIQFQSAVKDVKSSVNSSHRGSSLCLEVTLFNGQSVSGPITVENVGKIPVEHLTVTVLNSQKSDYQHDIVELHQEHVMQSLPLEAETDSHFDLGFHGCLNPSQPVESLTWSGKIKVSYSGGQAWELGMSRQASIDIRIEVLQSLQCLNFIVTPVDNSFNFQSDSDSFELSMDVHNRTSHDIEWRFEVDKEAVVPDKTNTLSSGAITRAILRLEKFDIPNLENKASECDRCSEKLVELVKLHWEIPGTEVSGVLDLEGLEVDEGMINMMKKYLLKFEIMVDYQSTAREEPVIAPAASPVQLTVKVSNSSDQKVKPSILNIEPFQVDGNGAKVFEVKHKVCWIGSSSTLLPALKVGESAEHTCGFLFLCPGRYFINVRCFEKADIDLEQSFRGRAQVIKADTSPGHRRSRSSRAESFTESLLLRQKSYNAPLAQATCTTVINVVDEPGTKAISTDYSDWENSGVNNALNDEHMGNGNDVEEGGTSATVKDSNDLRMGESSAEKTETIERRSEEIAGVRNEDQGKPKQETKYGSMTSPSLVGWCNRTNDEEGGGTATITDDDAEATHTACLGDTRDGTTTTTTTGHSGGVTCVTTVESVGNVTTTAIGTAIATAAAGDGVYASTAKTTTSGSTSNCQSSGETDTHNRSDTCGQAVGSDCLRKGTDEKRTTSNVSQRDVDEVTSNKTNKHTKNEVVEDTEEMKKETERETNETNGRHCKEQLNVKINEQISHEATASRTSRQNIAKTKTSPRDKSPNQTNADEVTSPSVQERIVFFSST